MYHGTVNIEIIGDGGVLRAIQELDPLPTIDHRFQETTWEALVPAMEEAVAANDLSALPAFALVEVRSEAELEPLRRLLALRPQIAEMLAAEERPYDRSIPSPLHDTRVIAVMPEDLFAQIGPLGAELADVWISPMTPEEAAFRVEKWKQAFGDRAEAWQTSQYLEATINSAPSLVWFKTAQGIHEKVNDGFCEVVRKEKDDVQGKGHAYIWDVEHDDPACIESERITMESRATNVAEESVLAGDETKLLTTYKSPLYNLDGSVMGTVGVGIDITQERTYREGLIQKNKDLEAVFMAMDCGMLIHSLDGTRVFDINKAALDILGYESVEELLDHGFDAFASSVIPEDADKMRAKLHTLKNVGDSINTKYRVRHDDGSIIYVIGNIKLIERNGELLYQRFLLDDSERQNAEFEREKRQEALLRALSESYTAVFVMDAKTGTGEILRLAPSLEGEAEGRILALPSMQNALDEYIDVLVHEKDKEAMRAVLLPEGIMENLQERDRYHILYLAKADHLPKLADGDGVVPQDDEDEYEYHQVTVAKAGTWKGDARAVVIGFRNVDVETREDLQQKAMLEEALDEAERANQAKSAFLTNMSHDIRTPMNAIIGFTTLAGDHIDEKETVRDYLTKINASSSHLLSLINDILDMSRIESGNVSLDEHACSMDDILENLISIIGTQAEEHELSLKLTCEGDMSTPILADKLKINQIMLNLLGNSVKFTPAGGSVDVVCERLEAPEGRAAYRLIVRDTGLGMEQEFLEHIFEPFERERTSTISGIQGTGLGMAITRNLVDMMEGTITVTSQKNVGTCFTVELSFALASEEEVAQMERVDNRRAAHLDRLKGQRVLVVEDNMINREIAQAILQDAGVEVDCAEDGQEAVEVITEAPADRYKVILMDVQMPVMNGYEATEAIRALKDPKKANIPILALTADAFEEGKKRALEVGMNGRVTKPIKVAELFQALSELL